MIRRLTLLLSAAVCVAAPASAQAASVVSQPLDAYAAVRVTGTSGADTLRLTSDRGTLRIEDLSGISTTFGSLCATDGPTAVECSGWGTPEVVVGSGSDHIRLDEGWNGTAALLYTGHGDDHVDSGAAWVRVRGGGGTDTVSFARYDGVDLTASLDNGDLREVEVLEGSPAGDSLFGGSAGETLRGGGGDDVITPGGGADTVDAGPGDDDVRALDGRRDRIDCGPDEDEAQVDRDDDHIGGCESWTGPHIAPPVPSAPPVSPAPAPAGQSPAPATRPAPRVVRPARGKRGMIGVRSRPAADAQRTRIGARIAAPVEQTRIRMTVRHGDRRIGQTEVVAAEAGDVVVNVPLDAELKRTVAQTRHAELTALVELERPQGAGLAEEFQATVVEPPPYVRGAAGVRRRGGFGEQRLTGTRRGDTLRGESGDDSLRGLRGNDRLHGGTGNDRLTGSSGDDHLDGYDGDDTLVGGAGDDLIIESRFGDDTLSGGSGNDWIVGGRGTDRISGGSGDDVIFGNSGSDRFDCGPGNDTVFVNLQIERETARNCEKILEEDDIPSIRCPGDGTADGETMLGSDDADVCKGHAGDDDVEGAGGDDQLFGGDGADRLFGRFGTDQLHGEAGDDELEGGRGRDLLVGGDGNDQLNGGYDRDRLSGGTGNDTLIARGGGSDQLDCGPGRDVAIADRTDRVRGCETIRRK